MCFQCCYWCCCVVVAAAVAIVAVALLLLDGSNCVHVVHKRRGVPGIQPIASVALAHHYILVGDEWSGVSFSKEQLAEEASRAICAYLGLQPTIAFREDMPDGSPTEEIEALGTTEIEIVKT